MSQTVKIIKLINGDDIVAVLPTGDKQLPDNGPLLRLDKPLQIKYVPQMTPMGFRDYIAMIRWTNYTSDKIVTIPKDKKVFYVHGGVDADEREKIREITEKADGAIIVASYGTFSTGINIRNLHNIIFASPSKSRIRNLQSIGRGLRLKDNNSHATLYDISDDLTYNEKENYTLNHFRERINIYSEEDFDYEIHNIELNNESNS